MLLHIAKDYDERYKTKENVRCVKDYLDRAFGNNWIGRGVPIAWSPTSPVILPLYHFIRGVMKNIVYEKQINFEMFECFEMETQIFIAAVPSMEQQEPSKMFANPCRKGVVRAQASILNGTIKKKNFCYAYKSHIVLFSVQ